MNKLILAASVFVTCSYFSNPIQTAEASEHTSATSTSKSLTAKAHKAKHHPKASKDNQRGTASWYGAKFHGKKTASGQTYNMYAMTAAHNTLPLLSYAKVTNLKNHRSVIVRINDRGSFHGKRNVDLSYAAAQTLGIKGTGAVTVTPLARNQALAQLSIDSKTKKRG
ncbi:MAG: septal ring lytic transglycosylase RlpA family protein [Methylobacter sp.]|jgi:rare lipoprotein A